MKKIISGIIALCLLTVVLFSGCADSSGNDNNSVSESSETSASETVSGDNFVDLTKMSGTVVYAQVYDIVTMPAYYIGKTIKLSGQFYADYYDQTDKYYFYAVISDALGCCQQGLEFIWNGDHKYPDDYPADGDTIEITGVFGSYEELGVTYYYLSVDDIATD